MYTQMRWLKVSTSAGLELLNLAMATNIKPDPADADKTIITMTSGDKTILHDFDYVTAAMTPVLNDGDLLGTAL